jgi:hypothetical protein
MATKIENYNTFSADECGIFSGSTLENASNGIPLGIQKSSINTIDGFCYNIYGQVSNLDCPPWDPGCNCYITQFRPKEQMKTDIELTKLKQEISECFFIKEWLPNISETKVSENSSDWFGIDFSNQNSTFNCRYIEGGKIPTGTSKMITTFTPNPTEGDSKYPYSLGISGISGGLIFSKLPNEASSRDDIGSGYTTWTDKINGPLFHNYLEYSKTNASFWNTNVKTPLLRRAFMALYGTQKMSILVNGDYNNIYVGKLVNIEIPISGETTESNIPHKRFAGTWMIYRIERTINAAKHTMVLFLMRDGMYPYLKPRDLNLYKVQTGIEQPGEPSSDGWNK